MRLKRETPAHTRWRDSPVISNPVQSNPNCLAPFVSAWVRTALWWRKRRSAKFWRCVAIRVAIRSCCGCHKHGRSAWRHAVEAHLDLRPAPWQRGQLGSSFPLHGVSLVGDFRLVPQLQCRVLKARGSGRPAARAADYQVTEAARAAVLEFALALAAARAGAEFLSAAHEPPVSNNSANRPVS